MPWYYANYNQRLGPVSDAEFARLAREKIIKDDTLVWQHGMPDWKNYAEVAATLTPPEIALPVTGIGVGVGSIEPVAIPMAAAPTPMGEPQAELIYANFGSRLGAALIDWLVILVVSRLLGYFMGVSNINPMHLVDGNMAEMETLLKQLGLFVLADSAIRIAYHWFFLRRFEATLGKMALGLKVVRSDGSRLGQGQILGRFFAEILSKYFTLGIGYLMVAFDAQNRSLHDMMCDTRVVKKRRD